MRVELHRIKYVSDLIPESKIGVLIVQVRNVSKA
jgi:hypothetical protein